MCAYAQLLTDVNNINLEVDEKKLHIFHVLGAYVPAVTLPQNHGCHIRRVRLNCFFFDKNKKFMKEEGMCLLCFRKSPSLAV